MRFHSAHLDNLRKLYVNQIQHAHSAETQIVETLPKMIAAATDTGLKRALQEHLQQTREHVSRIEQILLQTTNSLESKKSKPVAAMIDEGEEMLSDASNDSVRDAAIVTAAQRIEHYEIAVYGALRDFANVIGENNHADLLEKTLEEEKHAEATLTSISGSANARADRAA